MSGCHRRIVVFAAGHLRQRRSWRTTLRRGDVFIRARPVQRPTGSIYEGVVAEEDLAVQLRPGRRQHVPFNHETCNLLDLINI